MITIQYTCRYFIGITITVLFHIIITNIKSDIFVHGHCFVTIVLILQLLKCWDVSVPRPSFRIWNWTWTIVLLYIYFIFWTRILYRGVLGVEIDCSYGVWCRGLTSCLLYANPFLHLVLNNSWSVSFTRRNFCFQCFFLCLYIFTHTHIYIYIHHICFYYSHVSNGIFYKLSVYSLFPYTQYWSFQLCV